ncbi:transposase [Clostridium combesii]|uniref:transposase n=1 Tax=Clostridium combesii TaxID=39481 RepID=UPI001FA847D2
MSAQVTQHAFEDLNKDLSIGVDLGVEKLAVINCLDKPMKNINKSVKARKLKKKLKRLQRGLSRKYEANKKGNEFVSADRFYPSSKICSSKKEELKLKDRIYVCDECGLEIDRDKNASINLGNYKIA